MSEIIGKLFVDPEDCPEDAYGFVQVLFLGAVYGFILFKSSNLIADGSELLLLVPSIAGVVGSVVLPVLGAVPDGAIVLFSGMGANAQEQLSVGVGALAGSTIMLLTLPWSLSIISGRVNLDGDGKGNYRRPKNASENWAKLMPPGNANLRQTGVVVGAEISTNAKVMVVTALIYVVIQISAFGMTGTDEKDAQADMHEVALSERLYAFICFGLCSLTFLGYLVWNVVRNSTITDDATEEMRVQAIRHGDISLSGLMSTEFHRINARAATEGYGSLDHEELKEDHDQLGKILKPFFKQYDTNNDHKMSPSEMKSLFKDLNESVSQDEIDSFFEEADKDESGYIDFQELVEAVVRYLRKGHEHPTNPLGLSSVPRVSLPSDENNEEDEEEEEEIPDDLAGLSAEEQQRKIKIRAMWMMSLGTFIVLLFSDPMVDVLSDLGTRTGIPSFYISFIVAPLASNASELIAACKIAKKKTSKTISISIASLLGAAIMNNSLVLGIFMALMAFKDDLVWEYSAETITILLIEFIMGYLAMRSKTQTLGTGVFIMALFPLSIIFIVVLKKGFGLD